MCYTSYIISWKIQKINKNINRFVILLLRLDTNNCEIDLPELKILTPRSTSVSVVCLKTYECELELAETEAMEFPEFHCRFIRIPSREFRGLLVRGMWLEFGGKRNVSSGIGSMIRSR